MKILVAEDDRSTRILLCTLLKKWGHQVVETEDGDAALKALEDPEIKIAILDWQMPGVCGLEVCEQICKFKHFVYAIILTGNGGAEDLAKALNSGASDYILKPFNPADLQARLNVGERLLKMQMKLLEYEKMESVARLSAGLAHELNTPSQFLTDNLQFLEGAFEDVLSFEAFITKQLNGLEDTGSSKEMLESIGSQAAELDMEFLREDIPKSIKQSIAGVEHISHIVETMRGISRADKVGKIEVDVNTMINSVVYAAREQWRLVSRVVLDLDPDLPPLLCIPNDINHALGHILDNAAQAIKAKWAQKGQPEEKGVIKITTTCDDKCVEISIIDTGLGMSEKIRNKVFDPFFSTKDLGAGLGQGLTTTYSTITHKHNGTIDFDSQEGKGTTCIVRLPYLTEDTANELPEDRLRIVS